ncbi:hypothetical protein GC093_16945 [Paenibacillus sp. LMG 31456]|uniref:ABC-three component systems C-terminal domain-containing protein n=1 Tax=Paenibacillus foliorum TaxID=2654974 RepID=A0A972K0P9_9BACL|nr:ABC-three component system protein [Paenibacillus foliorum]NOU94896.1 hypothetical protein [Paenibacillus foliorum]
MEIYQKYKELAVKIMCTDNAGKDLSYGSGCLFQPDTEEYTYVLTAKHCLKHVILEDGTIDASRIKVQRYFDQTIEVKECFAHDDLDIAVIIVALVPDIPHTFIIKPHYKGQVNVYGYPERLKNNSTDYRHKIECTINDILPEMYELTTNQHQMTYDNGIPNNIVGLSGSGVYTEVDNNILLGGIFSKLKTSDGAYSAFLVTDASRINEILVEKQLPLLIPKCLMNFVEYIKKAFNQHDRSIQRVLSKKAGQLNNISPKAMLEKFNNKLFIPYTEIEKVDILNENIWSGWVSLLTYLYIESGQYIDLTNLLTREKEDVVQKIKFYFSEPTKRLEDIVGLLLNTTVYEDLNSNDCIIVNSNDKVGNLELKNERIKKILRHVGQSFEDEMMINYSDFTKKISCIHIDSFSRKFYDSIETESDDPDLEEKLRNCISEVLDNVI